MLRKFWFVLIGLVAFSSIALIISWQFSRPGFNPCYVGLWSVSRRCGSLGFRVSGFNPCYVGLWSVSAEKRRQRQFGEQVSILVMLDYGL